ncbi:alpha/beta hydrolase [Pseudomonas sp. RIT-PI-S]|uniref:alpha/beta hydrolase n=1 Tax=Pseudomonas sp. RIT-PI-S TaxID=3035295 RepID=UPI0021DA2E83|nr:alpha/beta hydrolase [Pseudomonas sp. RIT-PI-S]
MQLHPEVEAFLDLVEQGGLGVPLLPFYEDTAEAARRQFVVSSQRMRWAAPQDLDVLNCSVPARDGAALPLRLYRPNGKGPWPLLVYLHGGGFVVGDLETHDGVCREFASRTPCAVLAVDYRLAPEYPFPTAVHDVEDVLAGLPALAETYGLDLARLALGGDSAGANLATVLAQRAAEGAFPQLPAPRLQVLCYPTTDATRRHPSRELFGEGYLLDDLTLEWFYQHYAPAPEQRADPRCSPLLGPVAPGTAPAVVALAGFDPLLDEGRAYADHLAAAGVPVERYEYPFTHDFLRMRLVTADVEEIYAQLSGALAKAFE